MIKNKKDSKNFSKFKTINSFHKMKKVKISN